jgi:hypothetical protein
MHLTAFFGTILLSAAVATPTLVFAGGGDDDGPRIDLDEMESIEASLAVKSKDYKQPQKDKRAPDPIVDEKIGGDPTKPDKVCTTNEECGKGRICRDGKCIKDPNAKPEDTKDVVDDYDKYARPDTDDIGKPKDPEIGQFDGDERGWAEDSKGDPWFQQLIADLRGEWEYPEISAEQGVPVGCLHVKPDGTIADTEFKTKDKSGNPELDDSVERALARLKKKRDADPVPVPTHLLRKATTKWVCFRFKL